MSGVKEEIDEELGTRVQTTPKSTNDDLSIPGAFAQHSHCSNKRCNDTECSNYRDIGEFVYVYFRRLACFTDLFAPFSHYMV